MNINNDENLHLLANPSYHIKRVMKKSCIDDDLYELLMRKFPGYKVTKEDFINNISKIESIFKEIEIDKTVDTIVEEIILQVINERILFEFP